jgi:hypothetical protein
MYLRMNSEEYGTEDFGPYETPQEVCDAMLRILGKAALLNDGVERWFRPITDDEHDEAVD